MYILLFMRMHSVNCIQEWNDTNLAWNESEYGNISKVRIPAAMIWKPDILLYNRLHVFVTILVLDKKYNVYYQVNQVASWHLVQKQSSNFRLSDNFVSEFFLCQNFFSKIHNLRLFGEFKRKLKFLSPHNLICRNFAAVCGKIASSCPLT